MIAKPFNQIEKSDIENLVANSVPEDKTLEYKEILPGGTEPDKKEFLADISSFANAAGGDLIYGVKEKRDADNKPTGEPDFVPGLSGLNADVEILRLSNMIRDGIDPRIAGVEAKEIKGFPNGPVILFRIPKSWNSPHMVKTSSRFYSRTSRGKYPFDVREIRAAFALSEALPERIRRFRDDRLAKIIAGETPFPLENGSKIVLHVLPIVSFDPAMVLDLKAIQELSIKVKPMYAGGWSNRFNFDGFATFCQSQPSQLVTSYAQMFRNGAIEAVELRLLAPYGDKGHRIPSIAFEDKIIEIVRHYLDTEKALGFHPPIFLILTFIGVKGYSMSVAQRIRAENSQPIDRDLLLLPEITVEDFGVDVATMLRPAFDAVWQAAGWRGSINYDEDGKWKPHA